MNVSIEKLDASNGSIQNGSKDTDQNGHARGKRIDDNVTTQQNKTANHQSLHSHQLQEASMNRQEESSPTQTSVVKHSLLQFALQHFRYE